MEKIVGGKIYSIEIGEPKNGFSWTIGQTVLGNHTISEIIRDENNFYYFGTIRYIVYIQDSLENKKIWRTYENHKISITFDINS